MRWIRGNLREDKQGYLRIPITRRKIEEEFLLEGWKGKSQKEIKGAIMKLHLQFGHGSGDKIWKLTKEAQWSDGLKHEEKGSEEILKIQLSIVKRKKYKRKPAKPVVSFLWSKKFNETLATDIGEPEEKEKI